MSVKDVGLEEYFADFIVIEGRRGSALLFYDAGPDDEATPAKAEDLELAREIEEVLER